MRIYNRGTPRLNDLMNGSFPSIPLLAIPALALVVWCSGCASQEKMDPTNPSDQIKMGDNYSVGTWKVLQNPETATEWYRKAALQGDPEGQYRLGLCYLRGIGVPKNEAIAVTWFTKAAQNGNAGGQLELGNCYRLAEGVGVDLPKAYIWYNLAAASGDQSACQNRDALARRLTEGEIREAQRKSQEFWNKTKG